MMADRACVPVSGGVFRVNQVAEHFAGLNEAVNPGKEAELPSGNINITHQHGSEEDVGTHSARFAEGAGAPEIQLKPIQTVVKVNTRVPALYSKEHNQLDQQLQIGADYIYETKENLIFNDPDWGLLNQVDPRLRFKGEPTPDTLDELLNRIWKMPDFFVMHHDTLAAFHKNATAAAIALDNVEMFGSSFTTWRGLPILPTNKLHLVHKGDVGENGRVHHETGDGSCKTSILILRIGEDKQGVLSLFAAGNEGSPRFPLINVDFMGINDQSVASYMMTTFAAMAVATPGALGCADVMV